jgi:hypothetical protein
MQKQNVQVLLAVEYSQVRDFLSEVIEQEDGVDIIGQAQDTGHALTLMRTLRPDVAVIDSYLPHDAGLDSILLSRINGLDTAQAISKEMPNTRVILLHNSKSDVLSKQSLALAVPEVYSIQSRGINVSLGMRDPCREVVEPSDLIFASVQVKPSIALHRKATTIIDKVIFFGSLAFAIGWLLTITMIFLPIGIPLALVGGITVLLGLGWKLTGSSLGKIQNLTKGNSNRE